MCDNYAQQEGGVLFSFAYKIIERKDMILGAIGAVAGLASTIYGAAQQKKAAKEQEKLLNDKQAKQEAWYNRNYYQDYLNSVEAQNAIKKYKDMWAERTKEARARQVISGGSPAQAQAVAEVGAQGLGDMMGNLAAQGAARKQEVDAQKLSMDTNIINQKSDIEEARQQAGANLVANGISTMTSSLQGMNIPKQSGDLYNAYRMDELQTEQGGKVADNFKNTDIELPKTVQPFQPLKY